MLRVIVDRPIEEVRLGNLGIKLADSIVVGREENVKPKLDMMIRKKQEWFSYVCRRKENENIMRAYEMKVKAKKKRGRPTHRWIDTFGTDLRWSELAEEDTDGWVRWKCLIEMGIRQKPSTRKDKSGEGSAKMSKTRP